MKNEKNINSAIQHTPMDKDKFWAEMEELFSKGKVQTFAFTFDEEKTCLNMEARVIIKSMIDPSG